MKKGICLSAVILICLLFTSCADRSSEAPAKRTVFAMDTAITLTAYGQNAAKALEEAENEIHRLDTLMSRANENGDIYPININGSGTVSDETAFVINTAINIGRSTDGAFLISPLHRSWICGASLGIAIAFPTMRSLGRSLKRWIITILRCRGTASL